MKYLSVIIVSLLLLVAAILNLPYGFYIFLRIVVFLYCAYCTYILVCLFGKKLNYYSLMIVVGILYNPIIRIHLDKETWIVINLVTMLLIWYPYLFKEFRDNASL